MRKPAKQHTAFGVTATVAEHARLSGIDKLLLKQRIGNGNTMEEALSLGTPNEMSRRQRINHEIESNNRALQNLNWESKHRRRLRAMGVEA